MPGGRAGIVGLAGIDEDRAVAVVQQVGELVADAFCAEVARVSSARRVSSRSQPRSRST